MILLLLVARDEAELLRLNLEHHLSWGFDHVVVLDNASVDATRDVAEGFGGDVTYVYLEEYLDRQVFLPTALDPAVGPIWARRTYRTARSNSPLHTSYREGKTAQTTVHARPFRLLWRDLYDQGGEAALRDYYRSVYTLSEDAVRAHLATGELVHDSEFAEQMVGTPAWR